MYLIPVFAKWDEMLADANNNNVNLDGTIIDQITNAIDVNVAVERKINFSSYLDCTRIGVDNFGFTANIGALNGPAQINADMCADILKTATNSLLAYVTYCGNDRVILHIREHEDLLNAYNQLEQVYNAQVNEYQDALQMAIDSRERQHLMQQENDQLFADLEFERAQIRVNNVVMRNLADDNARLMNRLQDMAGEINNMQIHILQLRDLVDAMREVIRRLKHQLSMMRRIMRNRGGARGPG